MKLHLIESQKADVLQPCPWSHVTFVLLSTRFIQAYVSLGTIWEFFFFYLTYIL